MEGMTGLRRLRRNFSAATQKFFTNWRNLSYLCTNPFDGREIGL
jgi:hypothetical protein